MAWQSKTIGDIIPEAFEAATTAKAEAEAGLAKLNDALTVVQGALNDANTALNLLQQDLDELTETGFAIIVLTPHEGSWANRLVNAPDAPTTESGMYSCGYFNIASMESEASAEAAFKAMYDALATKMKIDPISPKLPDSFNKKPDIEVDLPLDKWEGLTFGELMPGAFNAAQTAWNAQKAVVANLQNAKDQVSAKIASFEAAITAANRMLSGLSTSGLYQYAMEPAAGSWITRAISETGAPSTSSNRYTFGFAAVAVAADLAGAQALYAKLQAVM